MKEIYKPIKGYEGLYEVSNLGRVKSLPKYRNLGKQGYIQSEKILKQIKIGNGYLCVCLYKNGIGKKYLVHRLVAIAFIDNPNNLPCVNHIDGDKENNCIDNLEWCTVQENNIHAYKTGLHNTQASKDGHKKAAKKQSKPVIAINIKTNEEIYFESQNEAARQLNTSVGNIYSILNNKHSCKSIKGYTFKYHTKTEGE